MADDNEQPQPTPTERLVRSMGNHLTLIRDTAAQRRRQLAELALVIEAAKS